MTTQTPPLTDSAYVLRHHPYGESSAVLVALTAAHGKLRADFKGAKGGRRHRGAALEPLTRIHLSFQPGGELARVVEVRVEAAPLAAIAGFRQGAFLEYAAGLLDALAAENDPQPGLFRLAGAAAGPLTLQPPLAALIYLEFFALQVTGLLPDLRHCPQCGKVPTAMRLGAGSASCEACPADGAGGRLVRLAGGTLRFFQQLRRAPPEELSALAAGENLAQLEAPLAVLLSAALDREIPGRAVLLSLLREPA